MEGSSIYSGLYGNKNNSEILISKAFPPRRSKLSSFESLSQNVCSPSIIEYGLWVY